MSIRLKSPSHRLCLSLVSIALLFHPGFSDGTADSKIGTDASSRSGTGSAVLVILIGISAVLLFFLYKLWQRKKRAEQYARLLKLFEEDDELEFELGLRD